MHDMPTTWPHSRVCAAEQRAEAADAVYQRAIQVNVGWFQLQVGADALPAARVDEIREELDCAALLDEKADRCRRLLGLVLKGDLPAAQALATEWVNEAAYAFAEREWDRSEDREAT